MEVKGIKEGDIFIDEVGHEFTYRDGTFVRSFVCGGLVQCNFTKWPLGMTAQDKAKLFIDAKFDTVKERVLNIMGAIDVQIGDNQGVPSEWVFELQSLLMSEFNCVSCAEKTISGVLRM